MPCDLRIKYDVSMKERAAELFADGHGCDIVSKLLGVPRRTAKGWLRIWRAGGTARLTRVAQWILQRFRPCLFVHVDVAGAGSGV